VLAFRKADSAGPEKLAGSSQCPVIEVVIESLSRELGYILNSHLLIFSNNLNYRAQGWDFSITPSSRFGNRI
jgi:hypothetical protein